MEKNYDEVIAEMLIELDQLHRKGVAQDERNAKFDKRLDLTIKRMVMAEKRLELLDKKMEQSIKDQKEFSRMQSKMNQYFLNVINKKTNGKG